MVPSDSANTPSLPGSFLCFLCLCFFFTDTCVINLYCSGSCNEIGEPCKLRVSDRTWLHFCFQIFAGVQQRFSSLRGFRSPTGPGWRRNPVSCPPVNKCSSFPVMGGFSIRDRKELKVVGVEDICFKISQCDSSNEFALLSESSFEKKKAFQSTSTTCCLAFQGCQCCLEDWAWKRWAPLWIFCHWTCCRNVPAHSDSLNSCFQSLHCDLQQAKAHLYFFSRKC